jgi:hypothetical protein
LSKEEKKSKRPEEVVERKAHDFSAEKLAEIQKKARDSSTITMNFETRKISNLGSDSAERERFREMIEEMRSSKSRDSGRKSS